MGLFRLKALLGGTYDSLAAPETSTLQQLQVRIKAAASQLSGLQHPEPVLTMYGVMSLSNTCRRPGCTQLKQSGGAAAVWTHYWQPLPSMFAVESHLLPPCRLQTIVAAQCCSANICPCPTQAEGFSAAIIDRFFRPFLGGIFFDAGLGTSSRLTSFVMRMLATVRLLLRLLVADFRDQIAHV